MANRPDIAQAITDAARTMSHEQSLSDTLQVITDVTRDTVPGFDHVGITTIDKRGDVEVQAAAGDMVHRFDEMQYSIWEGPCVDSLTDTAVVSVPHLRHDQRWPRYIPEAVKAGLRSQLAVKLYLEDQGTLGSLNCYSTKYDELDPEAEHLADLFATHAAIALGNARTREQLTRAMNSRGLIGQAIGMLMERYEMNEDRAFAFLVRASKKGNVKLRDVAFELVDARNRQ